MEEGEEEEEGRIRRQGMPNGAKGLMWKRMEGVCWTRYEGGEAIGIGGVHIGPTRQNKTGSGDVAACCCSNETCVAEEVERQRGSGGKVEKGLQNLTRRRRRQDQKGRQDLTQRRRLQNQKGRQDLTQRRRGLR